MAIVRVGALIQSGLKEAFEDTAREFGANLVMTGTGPYQVYLEIEEDQLADFRDKMNQFACGAISWQGMGDS